MSKASKGNEALRIIINGRVQGVGFRPAVYRIAKKRGIRGWVANTPEGAVLEIESTGKALEGFLEEIAASLPPQARIRNIVRKAVPERNFTGFSIKKSRRGKNILADIPPDLSLCPKCLEELFTPSDRRYLYPFINCTDCGPRFSIVKELPYDRPKTTMSRFDLCPDCGREYR
ncbi:MAG: acylphosphatase, partial [Endomicrobiales bacterium]